VAVPPELTSPMAGFTDWTPAVPDADLPIEKAIRATVEGTELFLFRAADRIYAMNDRCTHVGGPLHRGRVNARAAQPTVICPLHGSTFWLSDGRVIRGPATLPQTVYDARVNEGMVEVRSKQPATG
jgi:nitrite reductase/ring-hydroxylating ferredoxin subunit